MRKFSEFLESKNITPIGIGLTKNNELMYHLSDGKTRITGKPIETMKVLSPDNNVSGNKLYSVKLLGANSDFAVSMNDIVANAILKTIPSQKEIEAKKATQAVKYNNFLNRFTSRKEPSAPGLLRNG